MKIEQPYFDKTGKEIKNFDLVRTTYYKKGKKKYVYNVVALDKSGEDQLWFFFLLRSKGYVAQSWLKHYADKDRVIHTIRVVQHVQDYTPDGLENGN
jgi:ACT domain-containing protein